MQEVDWFLEDSLGIHSKRSDDDVVEIKVGDLRKIVGRISEVEDSIYEKLYEHEKQYYHNSKNSW